MAFQCGFFNSVNGDRKYTAEQMNNPYKGIVSNGVLAKTDDSTSFQVQEKSGLNIVIKEGYGIFADKWAILDADLQLTIPTPHVSYARIDSVIVRIDLREEIRNGSIEYLQGTPEENPVTPELIRTSSIIEYRLANITVKANAMAITQANIEDTRPSADCGFVTNLLQNSDISATYAQWQSQFEEWLASKQNDYKTFVEQEQGSYQSWTSAKKSEYENFVDDYTNYINAQRTEHEEFISTEQAEYNEWTDEKRTAYEKWFNTLIEDLSIGAFLQHFSNHYVTTAENETVIPIGISQYSSTLDILKVYINGLMLIPNVDYTINDFSSITLTQAVDTNTTIAFDLLKLVAITEDIESVDSQLKRINSVIPAECCETNPLADKQFVQTFVPVGTLLSGEWTTPPTGFLLCNGATFDENEYPDLYSVLRTNVLPTRFDHSDLGEIETLVVDVNEHIAEYDGYLIVEIARTSAYDTIVININGINFNLGVNARPYNVDTNVNSHNIVALPIKKGDIWKLDTTIAVFVWGRWYKRYKFIKY